MWIVELALRRPYTFVVVALLIALSSGFFMVVTPKDIFPNINIPIISVIWTYNGLPPEEFSQRITTFSEYTLSNNVNDIERMESQTFNGVGIVRLYFHPHANIAIAIATGTSPMTNEQISFVLSDFGRRVQQELDKARMRLDNREITQEEHKARRDELSNISSVFFSRLRKRKIESKEGKVE